MEFVLEIEKKLTVTNIYFRLTIFLENKTVVSNNYCFFFFEFDAI